MKLKYIELYGFKSFAEKTKLLFNKDISAIVGPNGSGKSNIADALRWVLGEQSAKSLRGSNMQDVIFSGTENKKPMNMAQVSIVLDNQDKSLPIAFDEVNVTRRVYRTGESEYLINKSPVRLKDIKELFLDTGIGKDGYSMIGQGRIDEILNGKPEERREIFDEASGISKNKYKKQEAQRRLAKNEENIERLKSELKVKRQESDILEIQSNNAKEGMKLTSKLEVLELNLLDQSINKASEDLINDKSKLEYLNLSINDETNQLNKLQEVILPIQEDINLKESKLESIKLKKIEQDKRLQKINSDIELLNEKTKFYNSDLKRLSNDLEIKNNRKKQYIESKAKKNIELEELKLSISDKRKNIEKLKENILELKKLKNDNENKYHDILKIIENDKAYLANLQIDKNTKDKLDITNEKLKKSYINEIELLEQKLHDLESKKNKLEIENKELEDNLSKNSIKINDLVINRQDTLTNIKNLESKIQNEKNKYITTKSQRDILFKQYKSFDGYYRSVQNLLQNATKFSEIKEKIVGVLADLVSIDDKYMTALEVALGSQLQNIVVNDENDGKFLIEYIKKNRIGRITFLPINKIKGYKSSVNHPKAIDTLNNLVNYDNRIEGIIDYYLSKTILVKDMDDALIVSRDLSGFRVITLDGEIINSWGSMVGGVNFKKDQNSLINRKKELDNIESKINSIKSNIENIDNDLKKSNNILNDIIYKLQNIDDENKEIISNSEHVKNQLNEFKIEKSFTIQRLDEYRNLLTNVEKDLIAEDYSNIEKLEKDIFEKNQLKDELYENIEKIDFELSLLDKNLYKNTSENEIMERDLNILSNNLENIEIDIDELDKSLKNDNKNIDLINNELETIGNKLNSLNTEKENIEKNIQSEKEIESFKDEIEKLKHNISKDYQNIENMKNSISENQKEKFKLEIKIENSEQKVNDLKSDYIDTYSISLEELDYKLSKVEKVSASKREISQIKNRLSEIGYFNYESIGKYNIVFEELQFMEKQYNDLIISRDDIIKMISNIEKEMKETFKDSFKKIQIKFDEIFKILFNGGEAEIKLDSQDILTAGIDIIARPPGKKLKSIALLSGGEKAMTAVALLFAIFAINPAAFCILDEIDAALDEANTKRYVKYLQTLTDKSQFIMITHRKASMEMADVLYGVTMEEQGVSKVITLSLDEYN